MIEAFREVANDDMGKEALKSGVKKVVWKDSAGEYEKALKVTFEDGVLTVDQKGNMDPGLSDRRDEIIRLLNEGL